MSNLNEKLREILENNFKIVSSGIPHMRHAHAVEITSEEKIDQIKQAFEEEGWHNLMDAKDREFMSGQEWYERFEKEIRSWTNAGDISFTDTAYLKAAKKASGVSK